MITKTKKPFSNAELCRLTGVSEMVRTNEYALQAARRRLTAIEHTLEQDPRYRRMPGLSRYMADLRAILKVESQVRSFDAAYIRVQNSWLRLLRRHPMRKTHEHIDPHPSSKMIRISEIRRGHISRNQVLRTGVKIRGLFSSAIPLAGHSRFSKGKSIFGNIS